MSKNLIILRHAKAEPETLGQPDADRELQTAGLMEIALVGNYLSEKGVKPDLILCSPALRTLQTAQLMAERLGYEPEHINIVPTLYEASLYKLLEALSPVAETFETVMLVGHNPHVSYLAEYLTGTEIESLSTCGVALINFQAKRWEEISSASGNLTEKIDPQKLSTL
jgi:phosphohistidine phosphatase